MYFPFIQSFIHITNNGVCINSSSSIVLFLEEKPTIQVNEDLVQSRVPTHYDPKETFSLSPVQKTTH